MRDDYKLKGKTAKVSVELEAEVAEALEAMQKHCKLTVSEIANTALKRFVGSHRDFLPPDYPRRTTREAN